MVQSVHRCKNKISPEGLPPPDRERLGNTEALTLGQALSRALVWGGGQAGVGVRQEEEMSTQQ